MNTKLFWLGVLAAASVFVCTMYPSLRPLSKTSSAILWFNKEPISEYAMDYGMRVDYGEDFRMMATLPGDGWSVLCYYENKKVNCKMAVPGAKIP